MQSKVKQLAVVGVVAFACAVSFILGVLVGEQRAYTRQYLERLESIEARIRNKPAFSGLTFLRLSDGGVQLIGELASESDRQLLRSELNQAIGEERAKLAILGVSIQ